jgi:L-cysteine:1D-myo-inositol 2-amino-2-deoxy-alpha-D-glucopyranoside ligase
MCAAQARAATGEAPFARHFVHAGMVGYQGHKMSKSRGNLVFVSALRRDGVPPAAIRLALLAHRYRSDWEWTDADLRAATERLARWQAALAQPAGPPAGALLAAVRAALAEDLDAPAALSAVDGWVDAALARADASADPAEAAAPGDVRATLATLLGVHCS